MTTGVAAAQARRAFERLANARRGDAFGWAAASALGIVATAFLGYFMIFSLFQAYDDEGWFLVSLRQYVSGSHLYRDVFTQYGPLYYEVAGGILRTLGHPVTTNDGRIFTLVVWLLASLLMGYGVARLTRSVLLGLAAQLLSFNVVSALVNEPMHPQGLVELLVAAMVVVAAAVPVEKLRWGLGGLGALAAALVLTKVNVGGFASVALVFACVAAFGCPWPTILRPVVYAGVAALPLLLMMRDLSSDDIFRYAVVVSMGSLAVVGTATTLNLERRQTVRWILPASLGAGVVAAVVLGVMILQGVNPRDVFDGAVLAAAHQRRYFTLFLGLPQDAIEWGVLALAAAAAWAVYRRRDRVPEVPSAAAVAAKLAVGVTLWLALLGRPLLLDQGTPAGLGLAVTLAWFAAVPIARPRDPLGAFRRLFLAALAVLLALQAYPVAGSQISMARFVFTPVGALALADAWDGLERRGLSLSSISSTRRLSTVIAGAALLEVAIVAWLLPLRQAVRQYHANVPLHIAAADRLRLPPGQAQTFEWLTSTLKQQQCSTFVSYPGVNSFYVLAGMRPPTGLNPDDWMFMLSDAQQQRVVDAAQRVPRLCALKAQFLIDFWRQGRPVREGPLVQFVDTAFRPIGSQGGYDVLVRK